MYNYTILYLYIYLSMKCACTVHSYINIYIYIYNILWHEQKQSGILHWFSNFRCEPSSSRRKAAKAKPDDLRWTGRNCHRIHRSADGMFGYVMNRYDRFVWIVSDSQATSSCKGSSVDFSGCYRVKLFHCTQNQQRFGTQDEVPVG